MPDTNYSMQGYIDGINGRRLDENRYAPDSHAWQEWANGWCWAELERQRRVDRMINRRERRAKVS